MGRFLTSKRRPCRFRRSLSLSAVIMEIRNAKVETRNPKQIQSTKGGKCSKRNHALALAHALARNFVSAALRVRTTPSLSSLPSVAEPIGKPAKFCFLTGGNGGNGGGWEHLGRDD
jgi:hypothetical protein